MAIRDVAKTIAFFLGKRTGTKNTHRDRRSLGRDHDRPTNSEMRQHHSLVEAEEHIESGKPDRFDKQSRQFDEGLSSILEERQRLIAGSIEVVGLEGIRLALGDRWSTFENLVVGLAESELRRSLGHLDSFQRRGDATFLIHFDDLDHTAAEKKAGQVASRIKSAIVEKVPEISRTVAVRPFVSLVEASEIEGSGKRLSDALFARLMKLRSDAVESLVRRRRSMDREITILFSPAWN